MAITVAPQDFTMQPADYYGMAVGFSATSNVGTLTPHILNFDDVAFLDIGDLNTGLAGIADGFGGGWVDSNGDATNSGTPQEVKDWFNIHKAYWSFPDAKIDIEVIVKDDGQLGFKDPGITVGQALFKYLSANMGSDVPVQFKVPGSTSGGTHPTEDLILDTSWESYGSGYYDVTVRGLTDNKQLVLSSTPVVNSVQIEVGNQEKFHGAADIVLTLNGKALTLHANTSGGGVRYNSADLTDADVIAFLAEVDAAPDLKHINITLTVPTKVTQTPTTVTGGFDKLRVFDNNQFKHPKDVHVFTNGSFQAIKAMHVFSGGGWEKVFAKGQSVSADKFLVEWSDVQTPAPPHKDMGAYVAGVIESAPTREIGQVPKGLTITNGSGTVELAGVWIEDNLHETLHMAFKFTGSPYSVQDIVVDAVLHIAGESYKFSGHEGYFGNSAPGTKEYAVTHLPNESALYNALLLAFTDGAEIDVSITQA